MEMDLYRKLSEASCYWQNSNPIISNTKIYIYVAHFQCIRHKSEFYSPLSNKITSIGHVVDRHGFDLVYRSLSPAFSQQVVFLRGDKYLNIISKKSFSRQL